MILILRGHIRNAFINQDLYNLVKSIYNIHNNLKIYIHTWNIFANNISWRHIEVNNTIVTRETFNNYFGDLKHLIQEILIDDDTNIQLIGNLEGTINGGPTKIHGWKNYWYGKYQIINYLYKQNVDPNEMIINCRLDLLCNSNYLTHEEVIYFIEKHKENIFTKNIFIRDYESLGIDNIYLGNIHTMYKLIHHFFYHLDDVLEANKDTFHQEVFVLRCSNFSTF
jgi:hypothetical protein